MTLHQFCPVALTGTPPTVPPPPAPPSILKSKSSRFFLFCSMREMSAFVPGECAPQLRFVLVLHGAKVKGRQRLQVGGGRLP